MATFNFLEFALLDGASPCTAASLPSAAELDALALRFDEVYSRLRLCHLAPTPAAALGNASTPEEVRLNQQVARLCQRFPLLLTRLQRDPAILQAAFSCEAALRQLGGVLAQLRAATQVGGVVLGAALTEQVDRVEAAASEALTAAGAPTIEQAALRTRLAAQEQLRHLLWSRGDARRQRRQPQEPERP